MILLHWPDVSAALGGQTASATVDMLGFRGSIDVCMQVAKDTLSGIEIVHASVNHLAT